MSHVLSLFCLLCVCPRRSCLLRLVVAPRTGSTRHSRQHRLVTSLLLLFVCVCVLFSRSQPQIPTIRHWLICFVRWCDCTRCWRGLLPAFTPPLPPPLSSVLNCQTRLPPSALRPPSSVCVFFIFFWSTTRVCWTLPNLEKKITGFCTCLLVCLFSSPSAACGSWLVRGHL